MIEILSWKVESPPECDPFYIRFEGTVLPPTRKIHKYSLPHTAPGFFAVSYPSSIYENTLQNTRLQLAARKSIVKATQKQLLRNAEMLFRIPTWGPGTDVGCMCAFSHTEVDVKGMGLLKKILAPTPIGFAQQQRRDPVQFSLVPQQSFPFEIEVEVSVKPEQCPFLNTFLAEEAREMLDSVAKEEAGVSNPGGAPGLDEERRNEEKQAVKSGSPRPGTAGSSPAGGTTNRIANNSPSPRSPRPFDDGGTSGGSTADTTMPYGAVTTRAARLVRVRPFVLRMRLFCTTSVVDPAQFQIATVKQNVADRVLGEHDGSYKKDGSAAPFALTSLFLTLLEATIQKHLQNLVTKLRNVRDVFRLANSSVHSRTLDHAFAELGLGLECVRVRDAVLLHDPRSLGRNQTGKKLPRPSVSLLAGLGEIPFALLKGVGEVMGGVVQGVGGVIERSLGKGDGGGAEDSDAPAVRSGGGDGNSKLPSGDVGEDSDRVTTDVVGAKMKNGGVPPAKKSGWSMGKKKKTGGVAAGHIHSNIPEVSLNDNEGKRNLLFFDGGKGHSALLSIARTKIEEVEALLTENFRTELEVRF